MLFLAEISILLSISFRGTLYLGTLLIHRTLRQIMLPAELQWSSYDCIRSLGILPECLVSHEINGNLLVLYVRTIVRTCSSG